MVVAVRMQETHQELTSREPKGKEISTEQPLTKCDLLALDGKEN